MRKNNPKPVVKEPSAAEIQLQNFVKSRDKDLGYNEEVVKELSTITSKDTSYKGV